MSAVEWTAKGKAALRTAIRNAYLDNDTGEDVDIRLQVYPSGTWALRVGDPSYDLDHTGYWGASFVPPFPQEQFSGAVVDAVMEDLIQQAEEQEADES